MSIFGKKPKAATPAEAPVEPVESFEDQLQALRDQSELVETKDELREIAKALTELTASRLGEIEKAIDVVSKSGNGDNDEDGDPDATDPDDDNDGDLDNTDPDADGDGRPDSDEDEDNPAAAKAKAKAKDKPQGKAGKKPPVTGAGQAATPAPGAPDPAGNDMGGICKALQAIEATGDDEGAVAGEIIKALGYEDDGGTVEVTPDQLAEIVKSLRAPVAIDARPLIEAMIDAVAQCNAQMEKVDDGLSKALGELSDLRGENADIVKAIGEIKGDSVGISKAIDVMGARGIGTPRGKVAVEPEAVRTSPAGLDVDAVAGEHGLNKSEIIKALFNHVSSGHNIAHETGITQETWNRLDRMGEVEFGRVIDVVQKENSGAFDTPPAKSDG